MRKQFRPSLAPLPHRQIVLDSRRPHICAGVSIVVGLLVAAVFCASGWNFYENRFKKGDYVFHVNDEISVSTIASDFSSVFCHAYEVQLRQSGKVYLLPSPAQVNTTLSGLSDPVALDQIYGLPYNVRHFYLLEQSRISVSACRHNGSRATKADILLIKGEGNLNTWRADKDCDNCIESVVDIPTDAKCNDTSYTPTAAFTGSSNEGVKLTATETWTIPNPADAANTAAQDDEAAVKAYLETSATEESSDLSQQHSLSTTPRSPTPNSAHLDYVVPDNDKYFLIIYYGHPKELEDGRHGPVDKRGIELVGEVKRTSYNIDDATQICLVDGDNNLEVLDIDENGVAANNSVTDTCEFNLPFNSKKDIVVHFEGKAAIDDQGIDTYCKIRSSMWVCLFGVIPVIIIAIFSGAMAVAFCRRRGNVSKATVRNYKRRRASRRKSNNTDHVAIVDEEQLPEGAQNTMAIQGS